MDKKADSKNLPAVPERSRPPAAVARALAPVSFLAGAGGGAALLIAHLPWLGLLALVCGFTVAVASALVAKTAQPVAAPGASPAGAGTDAPAQAIKRRLSRSQFTEGAEKQAEQALEQLRQLGARLASFEQLLGRRLSPTELTYERFRGAGEQVYLSVLDSLSRCADELEAISGMKLEGADSRYSALASAQGLSEPESQERDALKERLAIRDDHRARLSAALAANEKALTELDRTIAAIGQMNTTSDSSARLASSDLSSALEQLEEIARRAKRFT